MGRPLRHTKKQNKLKRANWPQKRFGPGRAESSPRQTDNDGELEARRDGWATAASSGGKLKARRNKLQLWAPKLFLSFLKASNATDKPESDKKRAQGGASPT